jgi:hypothetical protein
MNGIADKASEYNNIRQQLEQNEPLYKIESFYPFKDIAEWDQFVHALIEPIGLASSKSIVEIGCRTGALLGSIIRSNKLHVM